MNKREIIIRVLQGTASKTEREQLEEWLASESSLKQSDHPPSDYQPTSSDLTEIRRILSVAKKRRGQRLAAIFIALVVLIILLFIIFSSKPRDNSPLVFHDAKLTDVLIALESRFDITITSTDTTTHTCTFTGEFYSIESPTDALNILKEALDISWNKVAMNRFEVSNNGCN